MIRFAIGTFCVAYRLATCVVGVREDAVIEGGAGNDELWGYVKEQTAPSGDPGEEPSPGRGGRSASGAPAAIVVYGRGVADQLRGGPR